MKLIRSISIAAVISVFSLSGVTAQDTDNEPTPEEKAVQYRTEVMHVISAQRNVMRDMADGKRDTDKDTFINAANVLTAIAKIIPEAFRINAIVEGSTAKPEIWNNWDDFVTRAHKLSDTAAGIAKVAATNIESAKIMAKNIEDCGGCHDDYRIDD